MFGLQRFQDLASPVGRAVVHSYYYERSRMILREHGADVLPHSPLLVARGYDYGETVTL